MEFIRTGFEKLSNLELYAQFTDGEWKRHNPQNRMSLYQEIENREGVLFSRPAREIKSFVAEGEFEGVNGYVSTAEPDSLYMNSIYFTHDRGAEGEYLGVSGLDTVLHEGRHVFQGECIRNEKLAKRFHIKRKKRWMWMLNEDVYFDPNELDGDVDFSDRNAVIHAIMVARTRYFFQPLDLDARRYARQRMRNFIAKMGGGEAAYNDCIYRSNMMERDVAADALKYLKEENLLEWDRNTKIIFLVRRDLLSPEGIPAFLQKIQVFEEALRLFFLVDILAEGDNLTRGLKSCRISPNGAFGGPVESIEEMYCRKFGLPDPITLGDMPGGWE